MRRVTYDFVCSVGHYCAAAMYLRRHDLRSMSGPLDWVGMEPDGLAVSLRLLGDGFRGFLERSTLKPLPDRARYGDGVHDCYLDEGTGMLVYHDFPCGVPFDEAYAAVRAKYDRRVARLHRKLKACRRALLVFQTITEHPDVSQGAPALERLRARYPKTQIDLLVIEHVEGLAEVEESCPVSGVRHFRGPFHRPEVHKVLGDIALCDRIYAGIRCRGATSVRLRHRFERFLSRLLALPHVRGRARHEAARRWMDWFEARQKRRKENMR